MCGPGFVAGATKLFAGVKAAVGTAGGFSTVLTGVGGAVSAVSALQQGRAAKAQGQRNAAIQEQAALEALEAGQDASDRRRRQGAAARASQTAALAANGQDVTSGDALSILDDTDDFTQDDAFSIREDARRTGRAQLQGAANSVTAANIQTANARGAAFGTILGTGAKVGEKYRHWAAENGSFA